MNAATIGRSRLRHVPTVDGPSLRGFVVDTVKPGSLIFNRGTSKARGLLFYRLLSQAARTAHLDTDAFLLATGRGRPGRRRATHGDPDHHR